MIDGEPAACSADDTNFANNVIPCQQQGLEMDQLATNQHSENPQLASFASKNASILQSDMQVLKALRAQWHGGRDEAGTSDASGTAHGAIDDATITKLDSLHSEAFDVLRLNTTISLDQAIVSLANVEISTGKNADAHQHRQEAHPNHADRHRSAAADAAALTTSETGRLTAVVMSAAWGDDVR